MMRRTVSWIHFGDLHITGAEEQNYRDFLTLIEEANRHMGASIDFALLPGDNADDGEEDEYRLVSAAVAGCRFPVHAITGNHEWQPGASPFSGSISRTIFTGASGSAAIVLSYSTALRRDGRRNLALGVSR